MFSVQTKIRIFSAIILIPVTFAALILGSWYFGILMALVFGVAYYEWFKLSKATSKKMLYIAVGSLYFLISFSEFVYLRLVFENGLYLSLLLLLTVWASDTGGYIFGKKIGGALMAPTISPKKTWAGMAGAILGAALTFTLGLYIAPTMTQFIPNTIQLNILHAPIFLLMGAVMGYVGQIGDLLVSSLKRRAHAKDSGHLIPGHGGILDRIDSILLVVPVYVIVARYGLTF